MNDAGICFFTEIGRCLCSPVVGGGSFAAALNEGAKDDVHAQQSVPVRQQIELITSLSAPIFSDVKTNIERHDPPIRFSENSLFQVSAIVGTNQSWSIGGASGGAPSPVVNAGFGLILVAGTIAFLIRRRIVHT